MTLAAKGEVFTDDADTKLYRKRPPAFAPASWTAIPYHLWNNRGSGRMQVWIPERGG